MADDEIGLQRPGAKRARKGGIQQRLTSSGSDHVQHSSDLALLLLALVAAGQLSAPLTGTIAVAACKDIYKAAPYGHTFPMLDKLDNTNPNYAWKLAYGLMKTLTSLPALYKIYMPALIRGLETTVLHGILLPHELFSCLHHSYHHIWQISLVPDSKSMAQFWKMTKGHPGLIRHPLWKRSQAQTKCVPLGLHVDEVPVTGRGKIWCKMAVVFSWFGLLCARTGGHTMESMFLIWMAYERLFAQGDEGTLSAFMDILQWSFLSIWYGKWPEEDWKGQQQLAYMYTYTYCMRIKVIFVFYALVLVYAHVVREACTCYSRTRLFDPRAGTDLADGYFGLLFAHCGDLEAAMKYYGMPNWSRHVNCCALCPCTFRGRLSWLINTQDAPWTQSTAYHYYYFFSYISL